ncbi:MAG: PilZ domain [Gaiellales bacterium]|nr:PilZ domain [Gaiellales bacterium]
MSQPTREDLMTLALGVLPPPPEKVDVLSEAGGAFPLAISGLEDGVLHAYAPRHAVRNDLHLLARVSRPGRGRYEVEFEVADCFFHSTTEALVHLLVSGVRHRKARRASPRAVVSCPATAVVRFGRSHPRDTEMPIRIVDVSATGCAFVSQQELDAGDLMALEFKLAGRIMNVEARVVRMDPAPYGRYRAGCEITDISDGDRNAISALAAEAEHGSESERNPEAVAALAESRAASTALSARLGGASNGS